MFFLDGKFLPGCLCTLKYKKKPKKTFKNLKKNPKTFKKISKNLSFFPALPISETMQHKLVQ